MGGLLSTSGVKQELQGGLSQLFPHSGTLSSVRSAASVNSVFNSLAPQRFQSNVSPIRGVGCTARLCVSDTRCATYVIYAAYLEGRCSIQLSYGRTS